MKVDSKLEYLSRLFQKTRYKGLEGYVIARLWNGLDDPDIEIVPQQHVRFQTDARALTDLYLPQFRLHIEVNEAAHFCTTEKVLQDHLRAQGIEHATGHQLRQIDCRGNLHELHDRVDQLVSIIKQMKQELGARFVPWDIDRQRNPQFWRDLGSITTASGAHFATIDDVCVLLKLDPRRAKRGWQRKGGLTVDSDRHLYCWWPNGDRQQGWMNKLHSDETGTWIEEWHTQEETKEKHFTQYIDSPEQRITFYRQKDALGQSFYRYVGTFSLDKATSRQWQRLRWRRIDTTLNLQQLKPAGG